MNEYDSIVSNLELVTHINKENVLEKYCTDNNIKVKYPVARGGDHPL